MSTSLPSFASIPNLTGFDFLREARMAVDLARGLMHLPSAWRAPRGAREPVLLMPGFTAGDASMWPLRNYLTGLGWDARGWGLGVNRGDVEAMLPRVIDMVDRVATSHGAPVHLVGWSMGGFLAREVARDRPDLVAQVVTMGTPVVGGPKYTAAAGLFRSWGYDLDALEEQCASRALRPIHAPITVIYSRRDGVVAWQACIDRFSERSEHIEVDSTHVALGFDLRVWRIVADRLLRFATPATAAPVSTALRAPHAAI